MDTFTWEMNNVKVVPHAWVQCCPSVPLDSLPPALIYCVNNVSNVTGTKTSLVHKTQDLRYMLKVIANWLFLHRACSWLVLLQNGLQANCM